MKLLDRILIMLFNLCLIIVGVWITVVPIAKTEGLYKLQYRLFGIYSEEYHEGDKVYDDHYLEKETNTVYKVFYYLGGEYQRAVLTNDQLDAVAGHIVEFLFENKESFELKLDDVRVYNASTKTYELKDDVLIFGEKAIKHMDDVKYVFEIFQIISVVSFLLLIGTFAYILLRIGQIRKIIFENTMVFIAIFFTVVAGFLMTVFIGTIKEAVEYANKYGGDVQKTIHYYIETKMLNIGWEYMHFLFFPFQSDKVEESMLYDILPEILSLEYFISIVVIVVGFVLLLLFLSLVTSFVLKIFGEKIGKKIKQKKYSSRNITTINHTT